MQDPDAVIEAAERETAAIRDNYEPALAWFLDERGLDRRPAVVDRLADHLDVDPGLVRPIVSHLVTDAVDPVQQVTDPLGDRYVGVIDYAEHGWYYAFDRYDDGDGRQRSAVCAHCIHDDAVTDDVDAEHFTRQKSDYDRHRAEAALAFHYEVDHADTALPVAIRHVFDCDPATLLERSDVDAVSQLTVSRVVRAVEALAADGDLAVADLDVDVPDTDVQPGAQLQSGTTINGNTAWHDGNVSGGTGISITGTQTIKTTGGGGGNIVERDASGNAYVQYTLTTGANLSLNANSTGTYKITPTTSYDFGFLDYSFPYNSTYLTVTGIKQNGTKTVTPITSEVNVTSVGKSEPFTFSLSAPTATNGTGTLIFKAGKYV